MKERSCYKCVAPKRYPGCHATCPDYARDDAEHQERKAEELRQKQLESNLYCQREQAIRRTERHKKGAKGYG